MDEAKAAARAARRDHWRQIMREQEESGLSAVQFCREREIRAWQFSYWRKALGAEVAPSGEAGGFVELLAHEASCTLNADSGVWVEAGRWRLCLAKGFDAQTLRRAVEALCST